MRTKGALTPRARDPYFVAQMPGLDDFSAHLNTLFRRDEGIEVYDLQAGNVVHVLDTPRAWGAEMTEPAMKPYCDEALARLSAGIRWVLENATDSIDIVSLAPPADEFREVIIDQVVQAVRREVRLIRFLFGYLPGGTDTVKAFRADLAAKLRARVPSGSGAGVALYVGRVHGGDHGGGAGPLSRWNHAKILAADGARALVGGHNLWPSNYAAYPPVHDISLAVQGPAASAAQKAADWMWRIPSDAADSRGRYTRFYKFDFDACEFPNSNSSSRERWCTEEPLAAMRNEPWRISQLPRARSSAGSSGRRDSTVMERVSSASSSRRSTVMERVSSASSSRRSTVIQRLDTIVEGPLDDEPVATGVRLLGVARYPTADRIITDHAGQRARPGRSPSDEAKHYVLTHASREINLCQQDIIFEAVGGADASLTVLAILEALSRNPQVVVRIVVSPANAKSSDGAQYSWGSGAKNTYELLASTIRKNFRMPAVRDAMLARLHVAPFTFSNRKLGRDAAGYVWGGDLRFGGQQAQFSRNVPLPKLLSSGLAEPGNHSKFYMGIDHDGRGLGYVGSDNMYAHELFEFGYMFDADSELGATLIDVYWSRVWNFSGPNCVCEACGRTTTRVLAEGLAAYTASLGGIFRKPSNQSLAVKRKLELYLASADATEANSAYILAVLLGQAPTTVPSAAVALAWQGQAAGTTLQEKLQAAARRA